MTTCSSSVKSSSRGRPHRERLLEDPLNGGPVDIGKHRQRRDAPIVGSEHVSEEANRRAEFLGIE
jgi:hypothetical protein